MVRRGAKGYAKRLRCAPPPCPPPGKRARPVTPPFAARPWLTPSIPSPAQDPRCRAVLQLHLLGPAARSRAADQGGSDRSTPTEKKSWLLLEEELWPPWSSSGSLGEIDAAIELSGSQRSEMQQRSPEAAVDGLAALSSRTRSWHRGPPRSGLHARGGVFRQQPRSPNESHSGGESRRFPSWSAAAARATQGLRRPCPRRSLPYRGPALVRTQWPTNHRPRSKSKKFEGPSPEKRPPQSIVSLMEKRRRTSAPCGGPWDERKQKLAWPTTSLDLGHRYRGRQSGSCSRLGLHHPGSPCRSGAALRGQELGIFPAKASKAFTS